MSRPFRFGFSLDGLDGPEEIAMRARRAEDMGYSSVVMTDHFDDRHGPLVAMTAVALATTTLRVGTLVLANDYRHPAVLAKELASLDVVSGGRLEIGIGAGWMASDYEQAGLGFDRPGVRIERLDEAVTVLEGCLGEGPFDFAGDHYTIKDLDSQPKPVQTPRPPLLMAGGGRRMLALAARRADIVGINPSLHSGAIDEHAGPTATAGATDAKLAVVRDAAGDRLGDLEFQTRVHLAVITDDAHGLASAAAPAFGITAEQALASPHALVGTVDQCAARIEGWRERWGISYVSFMGSSAEAMAPVVERLAGL
ncbi:MAG: TIGR03621 family F420-dependent LLM class oxidoreductase [Acidimicrobiia bacterium]|nr:TIGR03621 family F420-dependent LLM class oxidoreductase [Acidimicrobiia bacterium]